MKLVCPKCGAEVGERTEGKVTVYFCKKNCGWFDSDVAENSEETDDTTSEV